MKHNIVAGRPYQLLEAKARVTNTSVNNATLIHSTAEGNNTTDCDLVFCGRHQDCRDAGNKTVEECYCCELNPDTNFKCFYTRLECHRHCPFCKT